jgi:hypothetical protein
VLLALCEFLMLPIFRHDYYTLLLRNIFLRVCWYYFDTLWSSRLKCSFLVLRDDLDE